MLEALTQIAMMLAIGMAAGAASFRHVHDVAAAHGQAGWLAWADAVVLELMSVASGLEMRRRKRSLLGIAFPAVVLVVAVALSLSAQVVDAEASAIGWIAAAIPALGFLVMVKIALSQPVSARSLAMPVEEEARDLDVDQDPRQPADVATVEAPQEVGASPREPMADPGEQQSPAVVSQPSVHQRSDAVLPLSPEVVALLPVARAAARSLDEQGQRVSRQALADAMRANGRAVSNAHASELLRALKAESAAKHSLSEFRRRYRPVPRRGASARSVLPNSPSSST